MKIELRKEQLGGLNPQAWLRRSGYALIIDRHSGQESFARRLTRDFYPRFHLYVQEGREEGQLFFNLHLDQKKASYEGQSRHSGEYEGEAVEGEAGRIQALLGATGARGKGQDISDPLSSLRGGELPSFPQTKKKSFFKRLFS